MSALPHWLERTPQRARWAGLALIGVLWLGLCRQLSVDWEINPQYAYGWGVPFLGFYLFWQRWQTRPAPGVPAVSGALKVLALLPVLGLLPIRLVQEANPDWRLVGWCYALTVVAINLTALYSAGGRPWVRHFWCPVAFILLSVPWPSPLESALTQSLMRFVASVAVEGVNWCGIPALRNGNLVTLATGTVDVDEACSGVRSLQGALMVAVFLGELNRLSSPQRWLLAGAGASLAVAFNLVRAFILTWITARQGFGALGAWHDPAGYLILTAVFLCLWFLGHRLRRPRGEAAPPGARVPPAKPWPATWLIGLATWLLAIEVGTELWYRMHELGVRHRVSWRIAWPQDAPGLRFDRIGDDTHRILRYNSGQAVSWQRPAGPWLAFWFRWAPGRASAQLAGIHTPELCLPAAGMKMTAALGTRTLQAGGLRLPFRVYLFEAGAKPMLVFFCLWEDRPFVGAPPEPGDPLSRSNRWLAVLRGQRHLGEVVLEVAMMGRTDPAEGARELESFLNGAIRVEAGG